MTMINVNKREAVSQLGLNSSIALLSRHANPAAAESLGNLDAAVSLYKQSDRILGKPDDDISLALGRAGEAIKTRNKLREQLGGK